MQVSLRVDARRSAGRLPPFWRFFGCDEPNYATMKDGQALLSELGKLRPGEVYFRTHNLLTSGDGTPALKWGSGNVYTEHERGTPSYSWSIVDGIFDSYLERGVRPYVEIGFMPRALSRRPEPYRHAWRPGFRYDAIFTGWRMPPRDMRRWGDLVFAWARHCVQRYGPAEVSQWYWQTWNEANLCPDGYWGGTAEEYRALHDYAADAVRRALPAARIGGPDTAGDGGAFSEAFLRHCLEGTNAATGRRGTPLDFFSFHAKGAPVFEDGHVRMGMAEQLRTVDRGFAMLTRLPRLKDIPVIIGECDPDGCAACRGPHLDYRNGPLYASYTAASFAHILDLAGRHGVNLEGALTWAFEFEDQPLFAGYRVLSTAGIPLPVLNVFRMFALMGEERLPVESSAAAGLDALLADGAARSAEVAGLASRRGERISVLAWHHCDLAVPGPDAEAMLTVEPGVGAGRRWKTTHYRIDQDHSNAHAEWLRMGSPPAPNEDQYDRLCAAGELAQMDPARPLSAVEGGLEMRFNLPRHSVSLIVLEPAT